MNMIWQVRSIRTHRSDSVAVDAGVGSEVGVNNAACSFEPGAMSAIVGVSPSASRAAQSR